MSELGVMKILMVSPECAPFAKVGGLADMVSSLSLEMSAAKNDVRIFMPMYSSIKRDEGFELAIPTLSVHMGFGIEEFCSVWKRKHGNATVYFLEFNKFYGRKGIYNEGQDSYLDNDARFAFMCRASLDFCVAMNWIPDIVHCHDWTAGLIPIYLNTVFRDSVLGKSSSVFTIHNLQHQGIFNEHLLDYAGLPRYEIFHAKNCEAMGALNIVKGAIYNSTKITTVSPSYAKEIQTPEYGYGLDDVLRFKASDMVGILNGIDTNEWNPRFDKFAVAQYSISDMGGKLVNKGELQKRFGLKKSEKTPIFAVISRLYEQKGLDMLENIIDPLFENMDIQIVLLGAGERWLEESFERKLHKHKGKLGVYIGYNNELSHLIEAGADFFVMPSRFEPCGLNQMYSMAYGTVPIVRATGGLKDTVENYDEVGKAGTGFVFKDANASALYNTIGWACSTWYDRRDDYLMLQKNAMKKDFSWKKSSKKYMELYEWAKESRH